MTSISYVVVLPPLKGTEKNPSHTKIITSRTDPFPNGNYKELWDAFWCLSVFCQWHVTVDKHDAHQNSIPPSFVIAIWKNRSMGLSWLAPWLQSLCKLCIRFIWIFNYFFCKFCNSAIGISWRKSFDLYSLFHKPFFQFYSERFLVV